MDSPAKRFKIEAPEAPEQAQPCGYEMKTPKQHILDLPAMYIGGCTPDIARIWTAEWPRDSPSPTMSERDVMISMGLYKIFDEILVNAADHCVKSKSVTNIRVNIPMDGIIYVTNDGAGIPVVEHPEHHIYIPDMIFGHLMSSGNYDTSQERLVGGTHGFGAKLTNIFSTMFKVDTIDTDRTLRYTQTWINNMEDPVLPATILPSQLPGMTSICFKPDWPRFGLVGLDDAHRGVFLKRVIDVAGLLPNIKIYWNNRLVQCKTFSQYVKLYSPDSKPIFESPHERWSVAVIPSPDGAFRQISFVNKMCTLFGGKHVDHVIAGITKRCCDLMNVKKTTVKQHHVKNNIWLFVNASIVNPSFSSQTKDTLVTGVAHFGSRCELSDEFIAKIVKSDVGKLTCMLEEASVVASVSKTDGKRTRTITDIPKLDDANWAGTAKSSKCTLILTEGDSAKTMVMSGLSVVGNDCYGVYPLRGKLNNLNGSSEATACSKVVVKDLKRILGLLSGGQATNLDSMRYGRIMIMTDQDNDGSHIKGLLINIFGSFWSELLKRKMLVTLYTPQVKVFKRKVLVHTFYGQREYEMWKTGVNTSDYTVKFYKGLGTSSKIEAKEYLANQHISTFTYDTPEDVAALDLAFGKKMSLQRQEWLSKPAEQSIDYYKCLQTPVASFVHQELVFYSHAANIRAIPSGIDGLKPSQRKILWTMIQSNQTSEIRVSQLAGIVSSKTAYHHGEVSLCNAIIIMAQTHVGSNNLNYIQACGQFGSRLDGGKDASSPRYISTKLSPETRRLFMQEDDCLLELLDDDGQAIEPKYLLPIIPTILINGCDGIGTGHSTHIPMHNPLDVAHQTLEALRGHVVGDIPRTVPWHRGFKGRMEGGKTYGRCTQVSDCVVRITELPVGVWTTSYETFINKHLVDTGLVKLVTKGNKTHDDEHVDLTLTFKEPFSASQLDKLGLVESTACSMTNMKAFDETGKIVKYQNTGEIIRSFIQFREPFYVKRRDNMIKTLNDVIETLGNKIRFIHEVNDSIIILKGLDDDGLQNVMRARGFKTKNDSYDYLLNIPIRRLTETTRLEYSAELAELITRLKTIDATSHMRMWENDIRYFIARTAMVV